MTGLCSQPALFPEQSYQILVVTLVLTTKQPVSSLSTGGENAVLTSCRQLQTITARLISELTLQLGCNLSCSKSLGIIHRPAQAQGLGALVTGR